MIYGAALFTVMKCHGLMKSPGKQIPGFERKKKKERLLEEQRKGKRIPLSIIFYYFYLLHCQHKTKYISKGRSTMGGTWVIGFLFKFLTWPLLSDSCFASSRQAITCFLCQQEEVCTNIEWGLSRWGRLDDKKDRMYSHERSELLIGLCIISLFI